MVTVTDVGTPTQSTRVRISVFDAAEHLISSTEGDLRRGAPVRLELPLATGIGRVQLRTSVLIGPAMPLSAAIAIVEDVDPLGQNITTRALCGPGSGRIDPQFSCIGWSITDITTGG